MLGNVNTSSALSAFEKMEEKGKLIYSKHILLQLLSDIPDITGFFTMLVTVQDLSLCNNFVL